MAQVDWNRGYPAGATPQFGPQQVRLQITVPPGEAFAQRIATLALDAVCEVYPASRKIDPWRYPS